MESEGYKKQKKREDNEVLIVPMDRGRPKQLGLGTPLGYPGFFFNRFALRATVSEIWSEQPKSEGRLNKNLESEGYKN